MLKLFYAKGTIAIAVAITLEEAGLAYEPVKVDFATGAQTNSEYLAINPKGRVPALITGAGDVMTETGALLDYVADIGPDSHLRPTDPVQAQHMRSVMYYIASTIHVAHAHKMRGTRWADQQSSFDDMAAKVPQTMAACADYVQSDCLRGDYVLGKAFSLADPYLFMVCSWMEGDGVTLGDYPQIKAYLARMEARDSVKSVRAKDML